MKPGSEPFRNRGQRSWGRSPLRQSRGSDSNCRRKGSDHNLVVWLALVVALGPASAIAQQPESGARLYANHCAACHGEFGEGDGPVAAALRVTMPNLRTLAMRSGGTFPAEAVRAYVDGREIPTAHGDRYMPIWGDVFGWGPEGDVSEARAEQRLAAIVEHVRVLQYE